MKTKPANRKKAQIKVPGRGILMNASTRVVPHRAKDRRRLKTRELVQEAGQG